MQKSSQVLSTSYSMQLYGCIIISSCSLTFSNFPVLISSYSSGILNFQRDLDALGQKVNVLSGESARLCQAHPESYDHIKEKEESVVTTWMALVERSKVRKDKLVQAEQLQQFLNIYRDLRCVCGKIAAWGYITQITIKSMHVVMFS